MLVVVVDEVLPINYNGVDKSSFKFINYSYKSNLSFYYGCCYHFLGDDL